jgi:ketosteroid isomerase-like protein
MSEENVEIVRLAYEHLNRGQAEAFAALCDDDFVMDMSGRVFNPDTYRGAEGIRRFCDDVQEAWASYHWEVEDARVKDDAVVALLHCEAQAREAGPRVDWHVAWLWRFRGRTPVSLRFYRDQTKALEAAGLSE